MHFQNRLNGSYQSLHGGATVEALVDFTGGIGEEFLVKDTKDNLFNVMRKAYEKGSMMG